MPEDMNEIFTEPVPADEDVSKEAIEDRMLHADSVDEYKWMPQDDEDGRGKICHICGKETNDWAGNPSMWSLGLPYAGGNGKRRCYHLGCVVKVIYEFEEKNKKENENV